MQEETQMAINIDSLPDANSNPNGLVPEGFYKFEITKAEMSVPKDPTKKPNLLMSFKLTDKDGKAAGTLFERMYDSDAQAFAYKYARFFAATKITGLTGAVELKDLTKIVVGRKAVCEVVHEQDSRFKDDPTKVQAKVPVFGSEIFWPLEQFNELINPGSVFAQTPAMDLPFDDFDPNEGVTPTVSTPDETEDSY